MFAHAKMLDHQVLLTHTMTTKTWTTTLSASRLLELCFPCHPAFTHSLNSPPVRSQLQSSGVFSQGIHPFRACPVIFCVCCVKLFDNSDIRTKKLFCHFSFSTKNSGPCPCPVSYEVSFSHKGDGRCTLSLSPSLLVQ